MERHWEAEPNCPSDRDRQPDVDTYRTLLTDVLRTFLRHPRNFSLAVLRLMDNKIPLRSDAQRTNILDTIPAFTDAYNRFYYESQLHCCYCAHDAAFPCSFESGMRALTIDC